MNRSLDLPYACVCMCAMLVTATTGEVMIEYSCLECTSSCIQALKHFTDHNKYRREDIRFARGACEPCLRDTLSPVMCTCMCMCQCVLAKSNPIHSQ